MILHVEGLWCEASTVRNFNHSSKEDGYEAFISVKLISQRDDKSADSHGMASVGRYVWSADRAGNNIEIIDSSSNLSVSGIDLTTEVNKDPAPDLMDVAPEGQYVFIGLRGPYPLTGNDKNIHNAKGTIPDVGVIHVEGGSKGGDHASGEQGGEQHQHY